MFNRLVIRAALTALAIAAATTSAFALDIRGVYQSSEGTIIFRQTGGNSFEGLYNQDNGRIVGSLDGNVLRGFWLEDSSEVRCSVPMHGTYYWGIVEFGFTQGGFAGRWDYCNQGGGRGWTGQR